MDIIEESIELIGFGFKTKKTAESSKEAVATILFGGNTLKTAYMKLNSAAIAEDVLNLKLTDTEKMNKDQKTVSIAPVKDFTAILNSTGHEEIPEEDLLRLNSASRKVKLSKACVESIYVKNGLAEELKKAEDWEFSLEAWTFKNDGRTYPGFKIIKLRKKPITPVKEKAEKSEAQKAQSEKKSLWMASEKAKGHKPTVKGFWEAFYSLNPAVKAWFKAEKDEGRTPTLKSFKLAYPKTVVTEL